jgi:hypothetical protein
MAKLIVLNSGLRLWALTKAEDYLLVDAYLLVRGFVPKSDHRFLEFERRYFDEGHMLADKALVMLNCILKRKGYDPLHLREGHSDSYTIMQGWPKAQERRRICDVLEEMTDSERALVLEVKASEVNRQIDRDDVYDATKATRLTPLEPLGTAKVAPTALTEQLVSAMDSGLLAPSVPSTPRASETRATPEVVKPERSTTKGRRVLPRLSEHAQETQPAVDTPPVDTPAQGEKRARTGTVKLAMLTAVQDEVSAIRTEMAALQTMKVENGALHAAVNEIERLKQVLEANQNELRSVRAALKAFQSSVAEVAIAA